MHRDYLQAVFKLISIWSNKSFDLFDAGWLDCCDNCVEFFFMLVVSTILVVRQGTRLLCNSFICIVSHQRMMLWINANQIVSVLVAW